MVDQLVLDLRTNMHGDVWFAKFGSCASRLLLLLLTLNLAPTYGRPLHSHHHGSHRVFEGASEQSQIDGTTYLMRFGYLPGSDLETGALRTDEELQRAVRHFQKFAHIPETGRLDSDTVAAMKKPRCGVSDLLQGHGHHRTASNGIGPPSGYTLGPSKWQKKWLTVRILNFTPDLNYHQTRDAIIRALYVWSDVAQLSFHEVQSGYADIYIQFSSGYHQDGYPFDGPGMVLAHAFFPGEDRGGDMHFDEDEKWTVHSETGVNLFMVAAHELGHSLGLAHSNVPGSLMYPWHQGYTANFKLHPDDISAIQYLYGPKVPPPPPPPPRAPQQTTPYIRPTVQPPRPSPPTVPERPTTTSTTKTSTTKTSTTKTSTTTRAIITPSSTSTASTKRLTIPSSTSSCATKSSEDGNGQVTHKPHRGGAGTKAPSNSDPCFSIDALSLIRGEMFLFSGKLFWRVNDGGVIDGYPVEITRFWYGFPKDIQKIDALFERSSDGRIVFFSGDRYWEFHGNYLASRFPSSGRPISDFGLPEDVKQIDAAFVWGHNRRTYVIVGDMYWKLNDTSHGIETYSYPRDMSMWSGVQLPVDAAFTHTDGHTYFFQGSSFWEFNNARMHVRMHGYPKTIGDKWLKCDTPVLPPKTMERSDQRDLDATSSGSGIRVTLMQAAFMLTLLLTCFLQELPIN